MLRCPRCGSSMSSSPLLMAVMPHVSAALLTRNSCTSRLVVWVIILNIKPFLFRSTLRINLARGLFFVSAGLLLALIHRPLRLTSAVVGKDEGGSQVYLSGLATVYTAWILTALLVAPLIILLVLLDDAYVWPCLLLLACLLLPSLYQLHRPTKSPPPSSLSGQVLSRLQASSSWPVAIYACLLGDFGFFCLGHQPTFPSIAWHAAFGIFEGDWVASASVGPAILVLVHTFASQILVTAALPLLPLISLHRLAKGQDQSEALLMPVHSETCSNALRRAFDSLFLRFFIAQFSLVSFRSNCSFKLAKSTMLKISVVTPLQFTGRLMCAFVLRRHLMMWKIFAPRFIFAFCGLSVVSCALLAVRFLVVHRLHSAVGQFRRHLLLTSSQS